MCKITNQHSDAVDTHVLICRGKLWAAVTRKKLLHENSAARCIMYFLCVFNQYDEKLLYVIIYSLLILLPKFSDKTTRTCRCDTNEHEHEHAGTHTVKAEATAGILQKYIRFHSSCVPSES